MTTLITGATGFIGRHLAAALTAQGNPVLALMRRPDRLQTLRRRIDDLGGDGKLLAGMAGDLDLPALGLQGEPPDINVVVHLGATFAWGLDPRAARRTNVDGALAVAELARRNGARLVMISGFMMENNAHLQRLGISPDDPDGADWRRVYTRAGAYEASKLEGALRVRAFANRHGMQLIEVQPATVAGHSVSGELDPAQPLFSLIDNLAHGRFAMVPGTPAHWLPLVSVDGLAALIAAAVLAQTVPERLLALDPDTPNLAGLLAGIAAELDRKPPTRHIPIALLAGLLKIPGMPRLMNTSAESLHFLQTTRFNTSVTAAFLEAQGLKWAPMEDSVRASAAYWRSHSQAQSAVAGEHLHLRRH
ncbi:MAG: NAD-dependent dehydratase [Burkholderiales bacterium RIFCSPLOWO2_02_FULL_57_36]|nr:MAG: NAD-dependent dehydratase [Burkholderiales bacterium RIFCSPLOWO2_02_FULL_57_36]